MVACVAPIDKTRREGDLARHADEDTAADHRSRHSGAELFNRLHRARAQHGTAVTGKLGEICGFKGTSTTVRMDEGNREIDCHVRTVLKKRLRGFKNPPGYWRPRLRRPTGQRRPRHC